MTAAEGWLIQDKQFILTSFGKALDPTYPSKL